MIRKLLAFVLIFSLFSIQTVMCLDYDMEAVVTYIDDGDSFKIANGQRVRLADINATDDETSPEYIEASDYLSDLILGKKVYLDISTLNRTDKFGRLVCVAYIDYDTTQYLNVNKELLVKHYANVSNFYNNEFDPSTWTLYVAKSSVQPDQLGFDYATLIIALLVIVSVAIIIIYLYSRSKGK